MPSKFKLLVVLVSLASFAAFSQDASAQDASAQDAPKEDAPKEDAPKKDEKKRATKEDYDLDLSASATTLKVGENGLYSIVIRAKNGTKIHPQAPLTVKLTASEGVAAAKEKLSREDIPEDADKKTPDLRTQLTARKKGDQKVQAEVSFFLCTDAWCQRMNDKVDLTLAVVE